MLDGVLLQCWSKTQPTIAMSSCESEIVALWHGGQVGKFVRTLLSEMQQDREIVLHSDSMSAMNSLIKVGLNRLKHLELKTLWIQQQVQEKQVALKYQSTGENWSDMLTKHVPGPQLRRQCGQLQMEFFEEVPQVEVQMVAMIEEVSQQSSWSDDGMIYLVHFLAALGVVYIVQNMVGFFENYAKGQVGRGPQSAASLDSDRPLHDAFQTSSSASSSSFYSTQVPIQPEFVERSSREVKSKICQGPVTYTSLRGVMHPRFQPLQDKCWGAWDV